MGKLSINEMSNCAINKGSSFLMTSTLRACTKIGSNACKACGGNVSKISVLRSMRSSGGKFANISLGKVLRIL